MAEAIGTRAAAHGHTVEILGRTPTKAEALAERIGHGATVGEYGARPAGDIVILAVLFTDAVDVVAHFGEALAGTVLVDITNPFNADASGVVTGPGDSVSHRIFAAAPEGTHVVKALNTVFGGVIARDEPLDAFFAGDDEGSKARVAEFLTSMGMRARDAGGLDMAHALEWAGILLVGVANHGAGFDAALSVDAP